jgi:hypothetical protein
MINAEQGREERSRPGTGGLEYTYEREGGW